MAWSSAKRDACLLPIGFYCFGNCVSMRCRPALNDNACGDYAMKLAEMTRFWWFKLGMEINVGMSALSD